MSLRRLGFISFIATTFVLGCFFYAWSAAQTDEKETYKKEVQEKLKALDKKIDEMNAKGAELKGDAKTEFTKEMTDLHKKRKAMKKEWRKVKHAVAGTWEKAKADMDAAVQDVEGAYDKAASRFKEERKN